MRTIRKPGRRATVVTGVVLAGVLVAGGATAFAEGSGSAAPSGTSAGAQHAKGKGGAKARRQRRERRALRLVARGVHGQVTVRKAAGGPYAVREWQRGQVTAATGGKVTVRSTDGTSWTWTLPQDAKITRGGRKITASALHDGDNVLLVGHRDGTANDAARVFAPTADQVAKTHRRAAQHRAKKSGRGTSAPSTGPTAGS